MHAWTYESAMQACLHFALKALAWRVTRSARRWYAEQDSIDDGDIRHFQTDSRATGTFHLTPHPLPIRLQILTTYRACYTHRLLCSFHFTTKSTPTRLMPPPALIVITPNQPRLCMQLIFVSSIITIFFTSALIHSLFTRFIHNRNRLSSSWKSMPNRENSVSNTFLDFFSHCLFVFILPVVRLLGDYHCSLFYTGSGVFSCL